MASADQAEAAAERKRRQQMTGQVTSGSTVYGVSPYGAAPVQQPYAGVSMEEAYNAEYGKPSFGSGVPGAAGRQARQSILDLRRKFAGTSGAFGQQLRGLRAGQAEAAEQYASAMAQRAGGMSGGLRQRGFENLLNQYRSQQARIGAQRRGLQADLFRDIASVRNLLDQKKFEAAVARAASVANYWNNVLQKGREISPELQALIEQYGTGGAK